MRLREERVASEGSLLVMSAFRDSLSPVETVHLLREFAAESDGVHMIFGDELFGGGEDCCRPCLERATDSDLAGDDQLTCFPLVSPPHFNINTTTTCYTLAFAMKRKRSSRDAIRANKRLKPDDGTTERPSFPLLRKYYPEVVTLRQYLASRLPKKRRKRLQNYARDGDQGADAAVQSLLDTTIVGTFQRVNIEDSSFAEDDLSTFTQQLTHSDSSINLTPGELKQSEVGYSCMPQESLNYPYT